MDAKEKETVEVAKERLKQAQKHQAEARELEVRADREVTEAEAKLTEALHDEADDGKIKVHFKDLIERESAGFEVRQELTLQEVWDKAYRELDVDKRANDILQAIHQEGPPSSLMEHLGLTLAKARLDGLCDTRFEIATGTGGA